MGEGTWSKEWSSSKNPGKQRKYRANAPYHHRSQFLSAPLDDEVREKVGTKTLPVRTGDRVKILRGDYSGERGEIRDIDREDYKIYIEGVNRDTVSGSEVTVAIDPSNVIVTKLNLDDDMRVEKYDITEADMEEISVDAEESEEPEDTSETTAGDSEEPDTSAEDVDYEGLVEENVGDVKDRVRDEDLDPEKVLEAEQENKDRTTLVSWLENRIEGDNDE